MPKARPPTGFEVAQRVRSKRAQLELTQPEFATLVGLTTAVISQFEAERRPSVQPENLTGLASWLGVTVGWLRAGYTPAKRVTVSERAVLEERDAGKLRQANETEYPEGVVRPKVRGDCLTAGRRFQLAVLRERLHPEGHPENVRADGLPDGVNCERPCPFVSCKYHVYLEAAATVAVVDVLFPAFAPEDMAVLSPAQVDELPFVERAFLEETAPSRLIQSCTLDLTDHRPLLLEEVGEHLNVTLERVRQIAAEALTEAHIQWRLREL